MNLAELLSERPRSCWEKPAFIHRENRISTEEFYRYMAAHMRLLRNKGIKQGDRIIILAVKSINSISMIYSCIFSGVVFVPIDPTTPIERLKFILNDCKPSMILIDQCHLPLFSGRTSIVPTDAFVVCSGEPSSTVESISSYTPSTVDMNEILISDTISPHQSAYIMYTSGSTGTPKGVLVGHEAIVNFLTSAIKRAEYGTDMVFLNFFPLHFDPVLMEIFVPWITGGTVVIFDRFIHINDLVSALSGFRITDFSCTPNVISMLVGRFSSFARYDWSGLRSIWFGGEAARIEDIRKFRSMAPHVRLFNGYGPTETVIACSLYELDSRDQFEDNLIPIGAPMDSVEFMIDAESREKNNAGELLVGGRQLMTGYWGREHDKAENHFIHIDGVKYFKTGDSVYFKDGNYYLVGRINNMIKLRGYRIHPEEIEAALKAAPDISCSSLYHDDKGDRLFCFVETSVPDANREALAEYLVDFLKSRLPDYMIPHEFIVIDKMPRLSSGKLDMQALRKLGGVL